MAIRDRTIEFFGRAERAGSFGTMTCRQITPFPYTLYENSNYGDVNVGDPNVLNNTGWSHIIDDNSLSGKGQFKPVIHTQERISVSGGDLIDSDPVSFSFADGVGRSFEVTHAVTRFPLRALAASEARMRFEQLSAYQLKRIAPDATELQLALRAMMPKTGDVSKGLGLIVFVAELRDWRYLARCLRHPASLLTQLRGARLNNLKDVIRELTRLGAEGRLLIEFAIKPFIKDLQNLRNAVLGMSDFLHKWNRGAERRAILVRHHPFPVHPVLLPELGNDGTDEYYINNMYPNSPTYKSLYSNTFICKGIAHLWYTPSSVKTAWYNQLMHQYDALGLGHIGSNVWNMIPFSFLVDYLVTTDQYFSQFDKEMTVLPVVVNGCGWSVKQAIGSTVRCTAMGASASATMYRSIYERGVSLMDASSLDPSQYRISPELLRPTVPSHAQMANVVALLRAMKR